MLNLLEESCWRVLVVYGADGLDDLLVTFRDSIENLTVFILFSISKASSELFILKSFSDIPGILNSWASNFLDFA